MAQHGTGARESRYWAASASEPIKPERNGNASDRLRTPYKLGSEGWNGRQLGRSG